MSLDKFAADLRRLPKVVSLRVCSEAAPELTSAALETFDAGEDAYGASWRPGADGQRVSLFKTGALASYIRYVAAGAKLRVALGARYAKYQVGKRPIFPRQGGVLPSLYLQVLHRVAVRVVREELGK